MIEWVRNGRRTAIRTVSALTIGLTLAGCSENGQFRGLAWFQPQPSFAAKPELVTLPESADGLGTEGIEGALRNALDLARQKRFAEARAIMGDVASTYPVGSDLWRVIKCSEMTLAIRGNEPALLVSGADAVERTLRDPLRPPRECVIQLSIARAVQGKPLPVNAPDTLAEALKSVPRETAPEKAAPRDGSKAPASDIATNRATR
jgi:hypothetical protein